MVVDRDEVWGVWGVAGEMKREKAQLVLAKSHSSRTHTNTNTLTHTLAHLASKGMSPYIHTYTHTCVCVFI